MADLTVVVGSGRYARSPILMPSGLAALSRAVTAETLHASETAGVLLGLASSLSRAVTAEAVRASESASAVMGLAALSRAVTAEVVHAAANTVTRAWANSGVITFLASAGHATVTGYTARLYTSPADGFVDSVSLGVPTPDGNFLIQADLTTFFGTQDPGEYLLRIRATDAGGSTDSPPSSPFALPLP